MFYEPKNGHGLPYNPFKALVSPRPIGWVSTLSETGVVNLAPYSFFNALHDDPPMVMLSFSPAHDRLQKDTLANILKTKEFVSNVVPYALRDAMNVSSANFAEDVDEFERAGLVKAPSQIVRPPRIADAPAALECRLTKEFSLPGRDGAVGPHIVIGEVVGIHIAESILDNGIVKVERYQPLARLGYGDYAAVSTTFALKRPLI